jgi:hypothetical protein
MEKKACATLDGLCDWKGEVSSLKENQLFRLRILLRVILRTGDDYVIRLNKNKNALNKIDDERHKAQRLCNVAEDKNAEVGMN